MQSVWDEADYDIDIANSSIKFVRMVYVEMYEARINKPMAEIPGGVKVYTSCIYNSVALL